MTASTPKDADFRREAALFAAWAAGNDTGSSSLTLGAIMMGAAPKNSGRAHPHDPSDLGRCLRLLDLIPAWKNRIGEMAAVSDAWTTLVTNWDELATMMDNECGIAWTKSKKAPQTYARMRDLLERQPTP